MPQSTATAKVARPTASASSRGTLRFFTCATIALVSMTLAHDALWAQTFEPLVQVPKLYQNENRIDATALNTNGVAFSENGERGYSIALNNGKFVITSNGETVSGEYDEFLLQSTRDGLRRPKLAVDHDGDRYAGIARRGASYFVVTEKGEMRLGDDQGLRREPGACSFSTGGRHLVCVIGHRIGARLVDHVVYFDGQAVSTTGTVHALERSRRADRIAWTRTTGDGVEVFLDGKRVGKHLVAESLQFDEDGENFVYLAADERNSLGTAARMRVIRNGSLLPTSAETVRSISVSPAGDVAWTTESPALVYRNDKKFPGEFSYVDRLAISTDGKHVAYIALMDNGNRQLFVDGRARAVDFQGFDTGPFFGAKKSSDVAILGRKSGVSSKLLSLPSGEIVETTASEALVGADAGGFAYVIKGDDNLSRVHLSSGAESSSMANASSVTVAPGGSAVAFAMKTADGTAATGFLTQSGFEQWPIQHTGFGRLSYATPAFFFSPDGKTVAFAGSVKGRGQVLYLHGTELTSGSDFLWPTFDASGRHFAVVVRSTEGWRLVYNGRTIFEPDAVVDGIDAITFTDSEIRFRAVSNGHFGVYSLPLGDPWANRASATPPTQSSGLRGASSVSAAAQGFRRR